MLTINLVSIFFASISLVNIDKVKINENKIVNKYCNSKQSYYICIYQLTKNKNYESNNDNRMVLNFI